MGIAHDLYDMTGKTAVVTGAGRGIGEGIATVLADAGAAVVCAARRTDEVERVAAEIRAAGGRAIAVTTDVTDNAAVEALAQAAMDEFGSLDTWVNNAGGSPIRTPLTQLDPAEWKHTMDLNMTAVYNCTLVAVPHMLADGRGGSIINITSMASFVGTPGSGHYAAAKRAVNSLTETFALELAPLIRVNGIAPGAVPTEIMMKALGVDEDTVQRYATKIPLGRLGTPIDLGAVALFLASDASAWITGQTLAVAGGR
jgi:NAD(P)-dependent dehydrogenase (short-subunit alcohol dehydrogenase family)